MSFLYDLKLFSPFFYWYSQNQKKGKPKYLIPTNPIDVSKEIREYIRKCTEESIRRQYPFKKTLQDIYLIKDYLEEDTDYDNDGDENEDDTKSDDEEQNKKTPKNSFSLSTLFHKGYFLFQQYPFYSSLGLCSSLFVIFICREKIRYQPFFARNK